MAALLFSLYTLLSGVQQGVITWLFTEYVPPRYQAWVNGALHGLGGLLYALLVAYAIRVGPGASLWATVGVALLLRLALFDIALNGARAWMDLGEGRFTRPLFAVGATALFDRAVHGLARLLGNASPSWVSAGLRLLSLFGAIWLFCYK